MSVVIINLKIAGDRYIVERVDIVPVYLHLKVYVRLLGNLDEGAVADITDHLQILAICPLDDARTFVPTDAEISTPVCAR